MPRRSAARIWNWRRGRIACVRNSTWRIVQKHVAGFNGAERIQWQRGFLYEEEFRNGLRAMESNRRGIRTRALRGRLHLLCRAARGVSRQIRATGIRSRVEAEVRSGERIFDTDAGAACKYVSRAARHQR